MKVLLIVDMQKGFIKSAKHSALSDKIDLLVQSGKYDKLIFTKFKNVKSANPLFQEKLGWNGMRTKDEQDFSVLIPPDAIKFEKNGYGLKEEDLNFIKSLNVKQIDICGLETEACVYAIALQLWDLGVYPNILSDYILGNVDMRELFKRQFGTK